MHRDPLSPIPLLWRSPLFDPSGYAEDARLYLRGLDAIGYPVAARPFHFQSERYSLSKDENDLFSRLVSQTFKPPYFFINQLSPKYFSYDDQASKNLGRILFETDRLPVDWVEPLRKLDQVWVASRFNFETFARSGIPEEKIRILPNAIDTDLFQVRAGQTNSKLSLGTGDRFVFLSVCDFSPRKGLDVLLKAWTRAFTQEDAVCLVLKTYSSAGRTREQIQTEIDLYIESLGVSLEKIAPIYLVLDILNGQQMPALYRAADAFVLLSHGEGWGRPYMEALACELPVVGSRWSAPLDFLDDQNSFLVSGSLVDVSDHAIRYNKNFLGHRWFEPDLDDAIAQLRCVFLQPQSAKAKAVAGSRMIRERYDITRIAKEMAILLSSL